MVSRRRSWRDYWRALSGALAMTLRGKTITKIPVRYTALAAWVEQGIYLVDAAFAAANTAGLDETQRKTVLLHLEGRAISMQVILAAVRFHLATEYPMLMQAQVAHNLTALYALNIDDQFRVQRLTEASADYPAVEAAIQSLSKHLQSIPAIQPDA
jgi:hypothetical protein